MYTLLQIQSPAISPGTGSFTTHSLEIFFICLVMFLLGWFLHHLIHGVRHKAVISELEANLKSARMRISDLEGDLESCNQVVIHVKGENAALSSKVSKLEQSAKLDIGQDYGKRIPELSAEMSEGAAVSSLAADIVGSGRTGFDASMAKSVFGKVIKEDDLKIVEGIGPKTEKLLNETGVHTWRQLSNTAVAQLQHILDQAGDRFQLLNPGTWPKQAQMAADGEWVALRTYQDFLVGGVEPEGQALPDLKGAEGSGRYIWGRLIVQDDLTVVEGIGPKISELLQSHGIKTWRQLGQTGVIELRSILHDAGDRFRIHDPGTWPQQAQMAAGDKWDELKSYQDFLLGGKDPA